MNNRLDSMKKFLPTSNKGFTLIELMVVVTIIAFLAVIGIVSFTNVQAQARDGRRRADIDAIGTAMEANRDPVTGYYKQCATNASTIYANGALPADPINTSYNNVTYQYTTSTCDTANGTTYTVCALLEKGNGNSSSNTAINTSGTLSFYCRASQQ